MRLELPYPPSDNRYYGISKNKRYVSKEGCAFRDEVLIRVVENVRNKGNFKRYCKFVEVIVYVYPPDRRIRDLLNLSKALCDSLVYSGVIEDDYLISLATFRRCDVIKGGKVIVSIGEFT